MMLINRSTTNIVTKTSQEPVQENEGVCFCCPAAIFTNVLVAAIKHAHA
jgi:hypothetical protein